MRVANRPTHADRRAKIAALRVAVTVVIPFQPLCVKAPQLITAHADIPRPKDQPHLREHGIVFNRL